MKVASIVGARPQFIKCAPISRKLREVAQEVLIHTGQHYDDNMSQVFFRELDIPQPDHHLGVGSGPHGFQTGEMLKKLEEVLVKERPDCALVYGDTNSTLAGALAAAKLQIPIAHVEAGLRSFNRNMPEEVNRVLVDHLSNRLFCPTPTAVKNLAQEGITSGVHLVGDVMYDALLYNLQIVEANETILQQLGVSRKEYFLVTIHRAENTDDPEALQAIVEALREISLLRPVIWPVHPRTRKLLDSHGWGGDRVRMIHPVSYLNMVCLEKHAHMILTDSGGVQKEAFWLQVPCVTLRKETEWIETVESGWNILVGTDPRAVLDAVRRTSPIKSLGRPFGDGKAAAAIVSILAKN